MSGQKIIEDLRDALNCPGAGNFFWCPRCNGEPDRCPRKDEFVLPEPPSRG